MKSLRFGKLPPKIDYRTLSFGNYLKDDIPDPPPSVDLTTRVFDNIRQYNASVVFPMYDNDILGNCTVAGAAHGITVYGGMVKQTHIPSLQTVVRIYNHLTGGVDSGLYLLDVVKYWRGNGIDNHKTIAYASVNRHNHTHVKQAIQIFGGLLLGFQCQEKVLEEFNTGQTWQPGKLINAGHAVYVTGYSMLGVEVLTWGSIHHGTWAWWDECVDEVYVLLPPEAKYTGFTPGFDYNRLKRDLIEVSIL